MGLLGGFGKGFGGSRGLLRFSLFRHAEQVAQEGAELRHQLAELFENRLEWLEQRASQLADQGFALGDPPADRGQQLSQLADQRAQHLRGFAEPAQPCAHLAQPARDLRNGIANAIGKEEESHVDDDRSDDLAGGFGQVRDGLIGRGKKHAGGLVTAALSGGVGIGFGLLEEGKEAGDGVDGMQEEAFQRVECFAAQLAHGIGQATGVGDDLVLVFPGSLRGMAADRHKLNTKFGQVEEACDGADNPLDQAPPVFGEEEEQLLGRSDELLDAAQNFVCGFAAVFFDLGKKAVPGGVGEIVGRLTHGARGYGGSNDDAFGDPSQVFLARVFGFGRLLALHHRRGRTPNRRNLSLAGVALGKSWSRSLLHDVRQFVRHESAVIRPSLSCSGSEHDARANGIGAGVDACCRCLGLLAGVDAHTPEVSLISRLSPASCLAVEFLAWSAEDLVNQRRRFGRGDIGAAQPPCRAAGLPPRNCLGRRVRLCFERIAA